MSNRFLLIAVAAAWGIVSQSAADPFDPPPNYYASATGTWLTLKTQLHNIIDDHRVRSYDDARILLQITDADPASPGRMLTAYDRTSVNVAAINPNGSIPGWDGAATWNREHTWPRSRGVGSSGPDDSDLFALRPALTEGNGDRGNLNFGGAFGQPFGVVTDKGSLKWYPGDADAGMIARQAFYMAVRYDGSDSGTTNLELYPNNPSTSQGMGDLDRMIEWHFAAPPDYFERRRNEIVFSTLFEGQPIQGNRIPFIDRPEFVWSVFVDQANDSQLSFVGGSTNAHGASTLDVDFGRRIVGAPLPAAQSVMLNKAGLDGTYYEVTVNGNASSSVEGRFNAFRTNQTGSRSIQLGIAADMSTAGLKTGTVTVDNLDITTGGGQGRAANDHNDVANLSLSVLDHANPSFDFASDVNSLTYDFGAIAQGAESPVFHVGLFNLESTVGYTAALELDSISATGDVGRFTTDLAPFVGASALPGGTNEIFAFGLDTSTAGFSSATYTLNFSDENVVGAAALGSLTLTLFATVSAAASPDADFDGNGMVDGSDFLLWQSGAGMQTAASLADGDADNNGRVDGRDLAIWQNQFGAVPISSSIPEPNGMLLLALAGATISAFRRRIG